MLKKLHYEELLIVYYDTNAIKDFINKNCKMSANLVPIKIIAVFVMFLRVTVQPWNII